MLDREFISKLMQVSIGGGRIKTPGYLAAISIQWGLAFSYFANELKEAPLNCLFSKILLIKSGGSATFRELWGSCVEI